MRISFVDGTTDIFTEVIEYMKINNMRYDDILPSEISKFIVAKNEFGKIVGFGYAKEYEYSVEIKSVCVVERYRNKGMGSKIALECIRRARTTGKSIWLKTRDTMKFWERFGFQAISTDNASKFLRLSCSGCNMFKNKCSPTVMTLRKLSTRERK